jgi:phage shock protein PspC (stress-responsive transcriptional regulator)
MSETAQPQTGARAPTGPRRLVRTPDGKIAGVAAGIGHYLGIDPTIVRIAFLGLLFVGGLGALLYVICWIAMPRGEIGEAGDARRTDGLDPWAVVGVAGLVVGAGLLLGWHGLGDGGRVVVAVALIAGGVALVSRSRGTSGGRGDAHGQPVSPPPAPPPATPSTDAPTEERGASPPPADEAPTAVTPTAHRDEPEAAGAASGRRGLMTGAVVSVLAIVVAVIVAAGLADWTTVTTSNALAIALVVIGAGLVVASVAGRAPWLFAIGFVLTAALVTAAAVEPLVEDGVGERTHHPLLAAEIPKEIRYGIGTLVVDLTDVELTGVTTLDVSLGIGEARLIVPRDVALDVQADVGVGALFVDGAEKDGIDRRIELHRSGTGDDRLVVDLHVGIGEGRIERE